MTENSVKEKRIRKSPALEAALIAGGLYFLICLIGGFFPGAGHVYMSGDGYIQYVPFIRNFWRQIAAGEDISFSFSLSLGENIYPSYAFMCLSPVNVMFAVFADADVAAFTATLIKLMLSAFFFARCVVKDRISDRNIALIWPLCYALCGFTVVNGENLPFTDAMYILPLLYGCLERFVKSGKKAALTAVWAYAFTVCFYTGFQLGVIGAVYFICMLASDKSSGKDKIKRLCGFVFTVAVAALISGVATLPSAKYLLFGDALEGRLKYGERPLDIVKYLYAMLPGGLCVGSNEAPAVYTALAALILNVKFFAGKGASVKEKILSGIPLVFLTLCSFVTPLYFMINAFDMPDGFFYRYGYMVSFALLVNAVRAVEVDEGKFKRGLLVSVEVLAELFIAGVISQSRAPEGLARSGAYMSLRNEESKKALSEIKVMEESEHSGFYRVYYENACEPNEPMFAGYNGIGYFTTLRNAKAERLMAGLGYGTTPGSMFDIGSTEATRMIFGQKYLVHATNPGIDEGGGVSVEKNETALPLGFGVSYGLDLYESGNDPFENINALLAGMCGEGVPVFTGSDKTIGLKLDGLTMEEYEEGTVFEYTGDENGYGRAYFTVPEEKGKKAYIYFGQELSKIYMDSVLVSSGERPLVPVLFDNALSFLHITELRKDSEGALAAAIISAPGHRNGNYYGMLKAAYLDEEELRKVYEKLAGSGLVIDHFSGTKIGGSINMTEDGYLFTSIPYNENWKICVDGNERESHALAEGVFLGTELSRGNHRIELVYDDPFIGYGAGLSAAGVVLLVLTALADRRKWGISE